MRQEGSLLISLEDCKAALRRGKKKILLAALALSVLTLAYRITLNPTFTATGIFKGTSTAPPQALLSAMENIMGTKNDAYMLPDDPRSYLLADPILEKVAKKLSLQGTLCGYTRKGPFRCIWENIKSERAYVLYKSKKRTENRVLAKGVLAADRVILPDYAAPISLAGLNYSSELAKTLTITFLDERRFQVRQKRKILGEGTLGVPFSCNGASFTLLRDRDEHLKGKKFTLSLVPLPAVTESLKKNLVVTKAKSNKNFLAISYKHPDRTLSALIVNAVMEEYCHYLEDEGEAKIQKQMSYLSRRKGEMEKELADLMQEKCAFLENSLGSTGFFHLKNEVDFLVGEEKKLHAKLSELSLDLLKIKSDHLADESAMTAAPSDLSCARAKELLDSTQLSCEKLLLEKQTYLQMLESLENPEFDMASLGDRFTGSSIQFLFERISQIHLRLADSKNWSPKEQERLTEELATQRRFLKEHIQALLKGNALQITCLQEKMSALRASLLVLLEDEYKTTQEHLFQLSKAVSHLPTQWLLEEKIELSTTIHAEIIEAISKVIEGKNISFHSEHLLSKPLSPAKVPVFPDRPYLLLFAVCGGLLGGLSIALYLCLEAISKGPSACAANLKGAGLISLGTPSQTAMEEILARTYAAKVMLFTCASQSPFFLQLICYLKGDDETIRVVSNKALEGVASTQLPEFSPEWILSVQKVLKANSGRLIFLLEGEIKQAPTRFLIPFADATCHLLTGERLHDLHLLPDTTLFLNRESSDTTTIELASIKSFLQAQQTLHLKNVQPLLEQLQKKVYFRKKIRRLLSSLLKRSKAIVHKFNS